MKLRALQITDFKNLRDFTIDFDKQSFTTVLLGQNGTGKSNLLEAVIQIFRTLDLGEKPPFTYVLDYECRGNEIQVRADHTLAKRNEQVQITVKRADNVRERVPYSSFWQDPERPYLPSYVFGYYSGPSNRMAEHFETHQDLFYRDQLRGNEAARRPLFYARNEQIQFALLAFFIEEEEGEAEGRQTAHQFLRDLLGIEKLLSVLFVLHKPDWNSKEGDPRFWNARGVLGTFLGHLYDIALAPMRRNVRVKTEFARETTREQLYLYLRNEQALKRLFGKYADEQDFFKALESTYISKVLTEVSIRFKRVGTEEALRLRDLSEGEQQLLMVLGLLRFTKAEEALFLLDEPDTHLNPAWSVQYLEFMRRVVGEQPNSHVLMTTHNPLVIAELEREDVRIMQRDTARGRIYAETPRESPRGMGVAGILTSELFGLRSALDLPTQRLVDEQRVLAAQEDLTQGQQQRLGQLTNELDELGFMMAEDDPLYAEFIKRFTAHESAVLREQVALTPQQQGERKQLIEEIIGELIAEGRWT